MSSNEQIFPTNVGDEATETCSINAASQIDSIDDILDEIDSTLEANAAAFVQGFVQKGGQ